MRGKESEFAIVSVLSYTTTRKEYYTMQPTLLDQLRTDIAAFLLDKLERSEITLHRAAEISKYVGISLPSNLSNEHIDSGIRYLEKTCLELVPIFQTYKRGKYHA